MRLFLTAILLSLLTLNSIQAQTSNPKPSPLFMVCEFTETLGHQRLTSLVYLKKSDSTSDYSQNLSFKLLKDYAAYVSHSGAYASVGVNHKQLGPVFSSDVDMSGTGRSHFKVHVSSPTGKGTETIQILCARPEYIE